MSLGYSIPDSTLRGSLAPSNIGSRASPYRLVCAGIYLIEDGRGDDLSEIISRIREAVSNASKHKREAEERAQVAINELRGYKAWRTGSLERASQLWSTSKPPFWQWGSLWRGDVFRELGKRQKAEDWYQAGWIHPVAHERLGQLYEELGEAEKAVAAYRRFAQAWAEADAPLQTRVEGARKRIQALGGEGADE